jgi:hypothetical protein
MPGGQFRDRFQIHFHLARGFREIQSSLAVGTTGGYFEGGWRRFLNLPGCRPKRSKGEYRQYREREEIVSLDLSRQIPFSPLTTKNYPIRSFCNLKFAITILQSFPSPLSPPRKIVRDCENFPKKEKTSATIGKSTRISKKSCATIPCRSYTCNNLKRILLQRGQRICYYGH